MESAQSRVSSYRQGVQVQDRRRLAERVRAEYREMPGLCLSLSQAARLLGLDRASCGDVFHTLVQEGFLRQTSRGEFVLVE
jgi:Holliday junction resolvasome RuvABC ATP-dependent DNA helicase subunit